MKLKRTVTIEFERVKITLSYNHKCCMFCSLCRSESEFISHTEAVEVLKILNTQGLFINSKNLHFYQPDPKEIFVCLSSIIKQQNQSNIFLTSGDNNKND